MSDLVTAAPGNSGTSAVRVGLTLGGIVLAAVVIFGLGVMEGARVSERAAAVAPPPSALPTETLKPQPLTAVAPVVPVSPDKLTFYDRLSGLAPAPPVALPDGQPRPQGSSPAALPESQRSSARQPEALVSPPTASAAPAKANAPAALSTAATTAVPSKSDPAAQIRKLTGKGRFTVQMAAVSERSAAAETTALIKRNGFDSVTVKASIKGKTWYRIRVGSFPNKQAATQAAGIFRSAFGLNAIPVES